jgi:hypothetical protein
VLCASTVHCEAICKHQSSRLDINAVIGQDAGKGRDKGREQPSSKATAAAAKQQQQQQDDDDEDDGDIDQDDLVASTAAVEGSGAGQPSEGQASSSGHERCAVPPSACHKRILHVHDLPEPGSVCLSQLLIRECLRSENGRFCQQPRYAVMIVCANFYIYQGQDF